jgi:hypothetical protein
LVYGSQDHFPPVGEGGEGLLSPPAQSGVGWPRGARIPEAEAGQGSSGGGGQEARLRLDVARLRRLQEVSG